MNVADFWERVDRPAAGCWLWQGADNGLGYGVLYIGNQRVYAHRLSYMLMVGPIPSGHDLDHLCSTPACVNPTHLEPVSHLENVRRGRAPSARVVRLGICLRGHPRTTENVRVRRGHSQCRPCQAAYARARRQRLTEERRAA
jgi:hypothetical protein